MRPARARPVPLPGLLFVALLAWAVLAPRFAVGARAVTAAFDPVEATHVVTARDLAEQIRQDGAQQTARDLTRNREWARVRRAVAAGWQSWIALMPDLMPVADPATERTLRDALRRALPTNPAAVLAVLDPRNGPQRGGQAICAPAGMPASWRGRALKAVRALHDIHLVDQGSDCLRALEATPS